ncbi:histone deacetylase family protein [Alkalilimnicola ehrlichii MLHE-1]|uniref:Histone deacetylase superfamily n=1 Tax=Alkalilimnicola ehrlichii (strain ATCC BAA-1101 / DSM 17681 / MLHE-1) TaxID=187272 RepID=Q0ABU7_ALKEH|nr:histone deacetylase family protein [Alkalilimnicola ehrlichii]ABI55690.1 histone deacetylase superfamily [Alkalilimnicola ehrlichii MLHE-1]
MTTWLITHPACLEHDTGPGHPESIARLQTILTALQSSTFEFLIREPAPRAEVEQLNRVHDPDYVRDILARIPEQGQAFIDSDTVVCPATGEAALRAAGAVCHAVDAVVGGQAQNAFCAVRPPGHHAEPNQAMGFCFFNNIAVGAAHAIAAHGLERVAIMDFDVHHGNGTQTIAERNPKMYYLSTHQAPLFPGTGDPSETGQGNIRNATLEDGDGSEMFRFQFEERILPELHRYKPQLVMISAGFDAHRSDPLATLRLDETDFAWATRELVAIARKYCDGKVVSALEGGYSLNAVGRCARAHVEALMT